MHWKDFSKGVRGARRFAVVVAMAGFSWIALELADLGSGHGRVPKKPETRIQGEVTQRVREQEERFGRDAVYRVSYEGMSEGEATWTKQKEKIQRRLSSLKRACASYEGLKQAAEEAGLESSYADGCLAEAKARALSDLQGYPPKAVRKVLASYREQLGTDERTSAIFQDVAVEFTCREGER